VLGFCHDEAITRWVKKEVVAVVVVVDVVVVVAVAVAVAEQLCRPAADNHTCSASRSSMCIVAR
jgi:hypothetical protein